MDIKQVATEILDLLRQGITSGGQAIQEQFPILCQQILRWGIISNILSILLSVSMMIICYKTTRFGIKKQMADEHTRELWGFLTIPSIIIEIFFFII